MGNVKNINLNQPHLFLDGQLMAEAEGLAFRIHPPRCEGIALAFTGATRIA